MEKKTTARNGARKIIHTCLSLEPGHELLILFDETTIEVADILMNVACEIGTNAVAMYIPTPIQRQLGENAELPLTMVSAIREALGILTCVTDDQSCLPFRGEVCSIALGKRSRIGHMPGVTTDMLSMADADYRQICADCELLAAALMKGKDLELITYDSQDREHRLRVNIGGWARPPAISNGLIKEGGWANLPPGETFIAPMEGMAWGSVAINGSLPGYVIPPGSGISLEFEAGELIRLHSEDPRCIDILDGLRRFALGQGDPNWCNLAEVGIGVNPAVRSLTGIELLDEKKYGTAHIALGENAWFGGTITSAIHSDLIILSPTIQIDGKIVIRGGRIETTWADWQEDHQQLEIDAAWRSSFSTLSRSGLRGNPKLGLLKREWISGRGDVQYLQVGRAASARKATFLYKQIPSFADRIEVESLLANNRDLDENEIYQLIRLMEIYELLDLA
jgi:leucyl aminopeptidase (aminopeptidase T)